MEKPKKNRTFTVVGEKYLDMYRNYISLRPTAFEDQRLFLRYQNAKCYRAVMGIHKIGYVPKEVAEFLGLSKPNQCTGHCLRQTSATILVDGGPDITCLKRHGGWKSNSVAEGYIEDSIANKNEIAHKILNSSSSSNTIEDILPTATNLIKSQQSRTAWVMVNIGQIPAMRHITFLNIMRLMYEFSRRMVIFINFLIGAAVMVCRWTYEIMLRIFGFIMRHFPTMFSSWALNVPLMCVYVEFLCMKPKLQEIL